MLSRTWFQFSSKFHLSGCFTYTRVCTRILLISFLTMKLANMWTGSPANGSAKCECSPGGRCPGTIEATNQMEFWRKLKSWTTQSVVLLNSLWNWHFFIQIFLFQVAANIGFRVHPQRAPGTAWDGVANGPTRWYTRSSITTASARPRNTSL